MLTAKVGETIINCFDNKYDRFRLKQWSYRDILKCPVCNDTYEYCHGEVIDPYFRHKEKDCSGYYSEPETDEHRKGKVLLYNWIVSQEGVENCKLESWIPETKQRPDIYFEYKGGKFVIEYQCTPIASEYLERRELYKLNNIMDIWILGTNKYNLEYNNGLIKHSNNFKTIEKEQNELIYFDVKNKSFIFNVRFFNDKYEVLNKFFSKGHGYRYIYNIEVGKCEFFYYSWSKDFTFIAEKLINVNFNNGIEINESVIKLFKNLEDVVENKWIQLNENIKKLEERKSNSSHFGVIGEKLIVTVTPINKYSYKNFYGRKYVHEFIDTNDNVFIWDTSSEKEFKKGVEIKLEAIIKEHILRDNINKTRLIRCKEKE